jgi:hypothetical protein
MNLRTALIIALLAAQTAPTPKAAREPIRRRYPRRIPTRQGFQETCRRRQSRIPENSAVV